MYILDMFNRKMKLPSSAETLPGRDQPMATADRHFVSGHSLKGPFPQGSATALFGLGCFWGAERLFWRTKGVTVTAAGYAGGTTPNPTYQEVCTGQTGHAEVVFVAYDPLVISYAALLKLFFESHDPTQGMRQGDDMGTQYRSWLGVAGPSERAVAEAVRSAYQAALTAAGHRGRITTEIADNAPFYYADADQQQYLAKHPGGHCGSGGTGIACPLTLVTAS
ncbi:peptide methionine sulfoxide reductase MsrA [Aureimonas sp. SA4125]|uniref:peptide-methionine (S)-S-oxide reductase MsrA n=1 Tax=Aureimonas sp. SA4125 TaxID=2826993 RepID=UPI001CC3DBD3|nr:peptide-methionine (S)-S-oxide reductase MsrA [Aureimonas sp. SA4125]BDA82630.1 peptide methionine sulfoxide reductase MsrA [Aureimonas sp. SA4125]